MTAPPNLRGSRSSLYNGGLPFEQDLPAGSCNYRDLSAGSRAPLCGCQRFHLNVSQHAANGSLDRGWCFCGHHACFHNAFSQHRMTHEIATLPSPRAVVLPEQEQVSEGNNMVGIAVHQVGKSFSKAPTGLGIQSSSQPQSQSINTRVWQALNDFARQQEDGVASITTSKLPSTAAPSIIDEPRSSPTRDPPSHSQMHRCMGPPVNIPQTVNPKPTEDYSATEVATPSVAGTPDFRALAESSNRIRLSPTRAGQEVSDFAPQNIPPNSRLNEAAIPAAPTVSLQDLHNLIRTYSQRLEALESLSFSQIPFEEVLDRFDLFDGRILDLETWRVEQDRRQSSPTIDQASRNAHARSLRDEMGSFASDASYDRNAAIHTEAAVLATLAANAETHPRIDALESRVADLENVALPSFANPWQVQVVLLPWSRELKGIWFSSHEATQHSLRSATQASEEWTGAQSGPNLSFQSTVTGAWTTQSIEAWAEEAQEWLSPKACGPSGLVFQRLASRGLVRNITLTAPDSRHFLQTINTAFSQPLCPNEELATEHTNKYQALRESLIPLRKIRKSSRLRFLDPSEMMTSAIWTASFLNSSVFMKTGDGQRRLYVTNPNAYIQPAGGSSCTWEYIRGLPACPVYDQDEHFAQQSNTESCWVPHDNLDPHNSVHSSFGASQWSNPSQMTDADARLIIEPPMSPWSESRIAHQRTVSLPNSATMLAQVQDAVPQRRVASFGAAYKHQVENDIGVEIIAKRRRISLSPEAERRGVNFTPRWSCEPPSPFTSEGKSQGAGSRKRGTTPFAYATPHSNSNYTGRMDFIPGDGDTEVDTDVPGPPTDHGDEEWEGMEDDNMNDEDSGNEMEGSQEEASIGSVGRN